MEVYKLSVNTMIFNTKSFCFLLIHLLFISTIEINTQCTDNDKFFADYTVMSPSTSLSLLENDTLEIICSVRTRRLQFFDPYALAIFDNDSRLQPNFINLTTISYKIENVKKMHKLYLCKYGECGIKTIEVFVGSSPTNVLDFKCRSNNWQDLNCTFTEPDNPIRTIYTLKYYPVTVRGKQECTCKLQQNYFNGQYCYLDSGTYRKFYEKYIFTLTAENVFGKNIQIIEINNYESVIPGPIQKPRVENVTVSTAVVKWDIPYQLDMWNDGFIFDVKLFSNKLFIRNPQINMDYLRHNNLQYSLPIQLPNMLKFKFCSIVIRYRSAKANNFDNDFWSENTTLIITYNET